jgi:hypothetical protein
MMNWFAGLFLITLCVRPVSAIELSPITELASGWSYCGSYHTAAQCNRDPDCYWVGALNRCNQRAKDCRIHGNKWACDQDPNCWWDVGTRSCHNRF